MEGFLDNVTQVNDVVNTFVWTKFGVWLLIAVGIILTIKEKLTTGTPILGYASLMSVVLFGFGLIFIMLSMLGEYIWRTLEESRKRPPFIIDEVHRSQDDKGDK